MLPKKWVVGVSSVLLILLLLAGYMAIAAEFGSKTDPLVTLSYIEELLPDIKQTIDDAIAEKTTEFDASIQTKSSEVLAQIDAKIAEFEAQYSADVADEAFVQQVAEAVAAKIGSTGSGSSAQTAPVFDVLRFKSGQTVIVEIGTEILWRIGTATCVSPGTPGLIDLSVGGDLPAGSQLQQNHLYVATVADRGFKATSDCVILIKGPYTTK